MTRLPVRTLCLFACVFATSLRADDAAPDLSSSIARGVRFLVKDQQPDGSWGTGTQTNGFEVFSMVPGSMDAYRLGASALCVMALREAGGETDAHDKGLSYLLTTPEARRDDGELMYNTWAHIYGLQCFAEEILSHNPDSRLRPAADRALKSLVRYATVVGGWNYYDFDAHTQIASMGPTSFGTAAGLVALYEARKAGIDVPQRLIDLCIHRVEDSRLPNGFYLYGSDYKYIPRIPANKEWGAVGRTQPCNYSLWLWQSPKVNQPAIRAGLDAFFKDHAFLDMGRKHPVPHQKWFQTSGYYYYYDHYYAARLLEALPPSDRPDYLKQIAAHVQPHQEPDDGSWWDFPMWDFHKPYGTAFAVMTLLRCK
jgi:hypothetical protein